MIPNNHKEQLLQFATDRLTTEEDGLSLVGGYQWALCAVLSYWKKYLQSNPAYSAGELTEIFFFCYERYFLCKRREYRCLSRFRATDDDRGAGRLTETAPKQELTAPERISAKTENEDDLAKQC